jgi:2-polyprenyl-6-methoxyphenol hydroxylase-like FAD-dependent oxidoreductase
MCNFLNASLLTHNLMWVYIQRRALKEKRFVNGAASLSEAMFSQLEKLENVCVTLGDAVKSVENYEKSDDTKDDVVVTLQSGEKLRCKQLIGAISPQLTSKIEFKVCL